MVPAPSHPRNGESPIAPAPMKTNPLGHNPSTPPPRRPRARIFYCGVLLALWAWPTLAAAEPLRVVVTIQPLALLLEALGGTDLEIDVLVPPGASPHAFETRPSDLVRVARADLFLNVGGGLDDWAARLAANVRGDRATHSLFALLGYEQGDHRGHGHAHDDGHDPHVWLDPMAVRDEVAPALTSLLIARDPQRETAYRTRLARFREELEALDRELRLELAGERRGYLAFHNAWRHFAARYALREVAVVEEAAGEQPTPREFASLVHDARASGVGAILIEPQFDPRLANTLSEAFGGRSVLVDPLGDPDDPARSTYAGLLRFNARAFRSALDAQPTAHP